MNIKATNFKLFLVLSVILGIGIVPLNSDAQTPESDRDKFGNFINIRPLRDFSAQAVSAIGSKQVDLRSNFRVVVSGELGYGADGKTIILKNPKSVTAEGDLSSGFSSATIKLVQDAVLAVGDSGYLSYLYQMKVRNVVISVEQTTELFVASIRADQKTESSAKSAASGLNAMFSVAKDFTKGDEQLILSQMKSHSHGKDFVLEFKMPRAEFHKVLDAKIAESLKTNAVGDAIK